MKRWFVLFLASLSLPTGVWAKTQLANAVAVIVNDAIITHADILKYIEPAMDILVRQYGNQPQVFDEKLAAAQKDGTERLVERQLILSDWKTSGYNLPESILDDEVKDRIRD